MKNDELKKAGLKVTLPRMKILNILEEVRGHMSAEDIYRRLLASGEEIALATVYRVLTQSEEAGLVERHNFEGDSCVFELKQDEHHDHLVCVRCGKVEEFFDEVIEERQRAIAKRFKFVMTDHSLNVYGICKHCSKA